MAITYYGGTIIECLSTDEFPSVVDGWFLKCMDTGETYIRKEGSWESINTGLAFIKASKAGNITTDGSGDYSVVFNTPYVDANYAVTFGCIDPGFANTAIAYWYNLTTSGFDIKTRDKNGLDLGNQDVAWLATRDFDP